MPRTFDDVAECVESTLARVGPRIVLALPLGIGKPNPLVNEFYRRARRDGNDCGGACSCGNCAFNPRLGSSRH